MKQTLRCLSTFLLSAVLFLSLSVTSFAQVLSVDNGTYADSIGLTAGGSFVWLNQFSPESFPISISEIQIHAGNDQSVVDLYIYQDKDGYTGGTDSNAECVGSILDVAIPQYQEGVNDWFSFPLDLPLLLSGPGDVLIACYIANQESGTYPAAIDSGPSTDRSWIGFIGGTSDLPPDLSIGSMALLSSLGFDNNFMIRAVCNNGAYNPSPNHLSKNVEISPTLSWEEITGNASFDLWFGPENSMDLMEEGIFTQEYQLSDLGSHVTYDWQVITHTASGDIISGDIWKFTTSYEDEVLSAGLSNFTVDSVDISTALSDDVLLPEIISNDSFTLLGLDETGRIEISGSEGEGTEWNRFVSFDVECGASAASDEILLLPLSVDIEISTSKLDPDLYSTIEDAASADHSLIREAILENMDILKVMPNGQGSYNLFETAETAFPGEGADFFNVTCSGDIYHVGLNLVIADEENSYSPVQALIESDDNYKFFLVFDGEKDGHFVDPLVVAKKDLNDDMDSSGSGGGGCNAGALPAAFGLLMIPLMFLMRK